MLERLKGYKFSPEMTVHCHNVNCCTVHSEYRLSSPRNKMVSKTEPLGYHIYRAGFTDWMAFPSSSK